MPKTYTHATPETMGLLLEVKHEPQHRMLVETDVKIGVIMAFAAVDAKTGERKGCALKGYGGAPAAAQIKVVPLKDRLTKGYDVELVIDGDRWPEYLPKEKLALLDHELTHLEPTGETDDLDRPEVSLRDEDFIVWGFLDVVRRHGAMAIEAQSVKKLIDQHGQLLLGGIVEVEVTAT